MPSYRAWLAATLCVAVHGAGGPPTWDTDNGAAVSVTANGIGNAYVKWPNADNNVFALVGYQLYMQLSDKSEPPVQLLDGIGYPGVREYLAVGLTPGTAYDFNVFAWNMDPNTFIMYQSVALSRTYIAVVPIGLDPTVITPSLETAYTWLAGESQRVAYIGTQPASGLPQTIGPICDINMDVSCVPGRTYVMYFSDICALDITLARCEPAYEGEVAGPLWKRPITNMPASFTTFSAYDEALNDGQYYLDVIPPVAGTYNLMVDAMRPGGLLGISWINEKFQGNPADIAIFSNVSMSWGSSAVVIWATEFVSLRWIGYLKPQSDGRYELRCVAQDYCAVKVNGVTYLDSIASGTLCTTGCAVGAGFELKRSSFYKIQVDFSSSSGTAFIDLQWKNGVQYPTFTSISSDMYWTSGFIQDTPLVVTVEANPLLDPEWSFLFYQPEMNGVASVGLPFPVYMQGLDRSGSKCTVSSGENEIIVGIENWAAPGDITYYELTFLENCVYVVTVTITQPGEYLVHGWVNGHEVSGSPLIFQAVSFAGDTTTRINPMLSIASHDDPVKCGDLFTVTVLLKDPYGNDIGEWNTGNNLPVQISEIFFQPVAFGTATVVAPTATTCGSRSNTDWTITCFVGTDLVFRFVDDSLLDDFFGVPPSTRSPIAPTSTGVTVTPPSVPGTSGQVSLWFEIQAPVIAGVFDLTIAFDDALLSGAVIPVNVIPKGALDVGATAVEPTMCLAHLVSPTSTDNDVHVEETDINLLVLIRDGFGNILFDRNTETVQLVVTGPNTVTSYTCDYQVGRLYSCLGWAVEAGTNTITATVNGVAVSTTSGGRPQPDECLYIHKYSQKCPCMQQRQLFSINIDVLPYTE